jgi:2-keto-4-pentenoate hydratase
MNMLVEREYADALWAAEQDRSPIAPLSASNGSLTVESAYAIQAINVARRTESGARVLGRKVGLTSRAMQEMLGVDEPDYGVLMADMFVEEGDDVDLGSLILPRAEAEIAFLLERDLAGPGITTAQVAGAVAGAMPALEIIDSRVEDWRIKLADTVADNASSARVVLGGRVTPIRALDLRLVGAVVTRNGVLADTGSGAAVLGNPLRCVAWLANKLAEFGEGLRAGDIVLAGALHRAFGVDDGDVCRAELAHLGAVTARFAGTEAAA